jgi:hypothetical protein
MSFRQKIGDSVVEGDFSKIESLIKGLEEQHVVDVGVLGDDGAAPHPGSDDESVAEIGAKHEFGVIGEGLPKRSFILMPIQSKQRAIEKQVEKNLEANLASGNLLSVYRDIGFAAEAVIQEAFETGGFGKWEPLAEITIEKKGSSAILIDEGVLRRSITSRVD